MIMDLECNQLIEYGSETIYKNYLLHEALLVHTLDCIQR